MTKNTTTTRLPGLLPAIGAMVAVLSLASLSCEGPLFGLGGQVDMGVPTIGIDNPLRDSYLPGDFVVSGPVKDDLAVKSVVVNLLSKEGTLLGSFPATISGDNYSVTIPASSTPELEGYTVIEALATDSTDKTAKATTSVSIDTKKPTVLVTSPLTLAPDTPIQSEYIDIKGEAFDHSPLRSIMVALTKADGSILAGPKAADGTNTWTVRFMLKGALAGLEDGKYFYSVVATDSAGNTSSYYFHRTDIIAIKDAAASFPAMDEIGKLDQNETAGISGITTAELEARRRESPDRYGDFEYISTPLIDFSFTNLIEGASADENLLAPNAKITGAIIPPTGAGSIKKDSVRALIYDGNANLLTTIENTSDDESDNIKVITVGNAVNFAITLKNGTVALQPGKYSIALQAETDQGLKGQKNQEAFTIDAEAPAFSENNIEPTDLFKNAAFKFSFSGSHSTILKNIKIEQSFNGSPYTPAQTIVLDQSSFVNKESGFMPTGSDGDGLYNYRLTLSTVGGKSTTILRSITFDTTKPSMAIASVSPVSGSNSLNGTVSLNVSAADSNGVQAVRRWLLPDTAPAPSWDAAGYSEWLVPPYSGTINTTTFPSGAVKLWLRARDRAGNEELVSAGYIIDQDTDKPVLSNTNLNVAFSTPAQAAGNLMENGAKFEGIVSDDDAVDSSSITIAIDGNSAVPVGSKTGLGTGFKIMHDLSALPEGTHHLVLNFKDTFGLSGDPVTVYFVIDKTDPTLTITAPVSGSYKNGDFTITGTASDGTALYPITPLSATIQKNAEPATAIALDGTPASWQIAANGLDSGIYTFTLTARDQFNKTTSAKLVVNVDKIAPVVSITAPAAGGWNRGATMSANGSVVESGGIVAVEYSTDSSNGTDGTWSPASGTSTWSATVPIEALGEGSGRRLYVRASDLAGNVGSSSVNFGIDQNDPSSSIAGPASTKAAFALSGSAADSNALASIRITQIKDGDQGSATIVYDALLSGKSVGWSTDSPLPHGGLSTGSYEYTISVRDAANNQKEYTKTVTIDLDPPTSSISNPVGSDILFGNSYTARGTASDTGPSLLNRVEYSTNSTDGVNGTWAIASGTANWNVTFDLATLGEGTKKLWTRAIDNAENIQTTPTSISFMVDQNPPTLSETTSTLAEDLVYRAASVNFGGASTDTNGIKSLVVRYEKGGVQTTALNQTSGDASWAWTLDRATGDGLYIITITATDNANRTSTITRKVNIDTTGPSLTVNAPVSGQASTTQSFPISGTALDTGGAGFDGTLDVEYSLDNWNTSAPLTLTAGAWSTTLDLGATQGARTLYMRSTDRLGNVSNVTVPFFYDKDLPTITETLVNTTDTQYVNADKALSISASDSWMLHATEAVSVSVNGAAPTVIPGTEGVYPYTFPVDTDGAATGDTTGYQDGEYILTFTAKDAANRTRTVTRTIVVDTSAPTLSGITNLADAWLPYESNSVSGNATDGSGSGVALVEYSINGADWSPFSGTTSFSGTLSIPSGATNSLRIRARDRAGNYSDLHSQTVRVDRVKPSVSLVSPGFIPYLSGLADLPATFNGIDGESGVARIEVKAGENNFTSPDAFVAGPPGSGTANNGNWSLSIPAACIDGMAEGQRDIYVRVIDTTGNYSTISFPVLVDKTDPSAGFTSPAALATVNKLISLSGTASDSQSLASVTVSVQTGPDTWSTLQTFSASAAYNWTIANVNTETWDDYDADPQVGIQIRFRATATDAAGRSYSAYRLLNADQDSDRPVIKITNLASFDGTTTLKMARTVFGTVSDDDGTPGQFEISENGTVWSNVPIDGGTWSYDASAGDGLKSLYFRVTDAVGAVFTTDVGSEPRIQLGAGYYETFVRFRVDTLPPEFAASESVRVDRTSPFNFADMVDMSSSMSFGGPNRYFALRVLARDANGIASVRVFVPGAAGSPFTASANGNDPVQTAFGRYDTGTIDVGPVPDGSITIAIELTDNSGLTATSSRTIIVDNTAPTLGFIAPATGSLVKADATISGNASDSGSGLAEVRYRVGRNYTAEPYLVPAGSTYLWEIPFDLEDTFYTSSAESWLDSSSGTDIYILPYIVRVTDQAGNSRETVPITGLGSTRPNGTSLTHPSLSSAPNNALVKTGQVVMVGDHARIITGYNSSTGTISWSGAADVGETGFTILEYALRINPDGDRPSATISYPPSGTTLGGNIRVYGVAEDNQAVAEVWMQIDTNGDGVFSAADDAIGGWFNGGKGKKIDGASSWNSTINTAREFDPVDPGTTRKLDIRVMAIDINGKAGPWTPPITIYVDAQVPQIGSSASLVLDPDGDPNNGNEIPYTYGMYIRGSWYLRGSIEDEGAIDRITISGAISSSLVWNGSAYTGDTGDFVLKDFSGTEPAKRRRIDLNIPVVCPPDTSSALNFNISALDNSTPSKETYLGMRLNIDTKAPSAALTTPTSSSTLVQQSDGWYKVKGTAQDDGSDISRVEVFFVRRGAATAQDRIYNPLKSSANMSYLSAITLDANGSPVLTGSASRSNTTSLSAAALVNHPMINIGQKILVGNELRTVSAYTAASGTISWQDGDVGTGITSYTLRLAIQVDKKDITEYWNGAEIINDDGDGYVEYLKQSSGTTYTWFVDINSMNIPDGPIEIHYIAYDQSGNATHHRTPNRVEGGFYSVQNNGPRVAAIILGSDLNGNGTVDAGETVQYNYSSATSDNLLVTTPFLVKDGPMSLKPVVTNGNGNLRARMSVVGSGYSVSDHLLRDGGGTYPISIASASFGAGLNQVNEGARTFTIEIWDSTEELTVFVDTLKLTRSVTATIDTVDDIAPYAAIRPFYWNSASDNSLYGNSRANGHIEITGVYDGTDPDVSGQISVRGTAYDDQRLSAIYAYMDGFTFTGGTTKTIGAYTYTLIGSYASGSWTPADQWAARGWRSSVTDAGIGQDGHRASWQLDIDTSRITGVAAANRVIRVVTEDKALNPSLATASTSVLSGSGTRTASNRISVTPNAAIKAGQLIVLGSGDQAYASRISSYNEGSIVFDGTVDVSVTGYTLYLDEHRNPLYQVDVVPYITGISRNSTNYNTYRSRQGWYSVRQGETLYLTGFNIYNSGSDRVSLSNTSGTTTQYAISGAGSSAVSITNLAATVSSGPLSITVNDVTSINNLTDNTKPWNIEATVSAQLDGSALWTDDRYIHVWRSDDNQTGANRGYFTGSDKPVHPAMTSNAGILYGSWSNYASANVYYGPNNGNRNTIFHAYDPLEHTDISYGNRVTVAINANIYGDNNWGVTGAGGSYVWDSQATNANQYSGTPTGGVYNAERLGHNQLLMQFINQRVVNQGNNIHLSYYDTDSKSLHYWYRLSGTNSAYSSTWINIDGGSDGDDTGRIVSANRSTAAGEYSAIDVTPGTNYPVIAYNDIANKTVKIARASALNPTAAQWTTQDVLASSDPNYLFSGKYVTMKIDSAGYVHLAFYRNSTGDLIYMRSTNNPTNGTTAYTFGPSVVIDSIGSVGVWADLTLNGNNPVISYLDSSLTDTFDGIKMAYYDPALETLDGDIADIPDTIDGWETVHAALVYDVSSIRTSIEPNTGTGFWKNAIGYASSDYFRIAYYVRQ